MLLFLYSAAIFFHSSTLGTPALLMASLGFSMGLSLAMSRISTNDTGISPGPPNLPMGLATNHSGFDCAMTMMASPDLAFSSSDRSALKSNMTTPYTIGPDRPGWDLRCAAVAAAAADAADADVGPWESLYPESWSGLLRGADGGARMLSELPLSRSVRPRAWKKATGTRPRASGSAGLQASYQSVSSSRPMTWKKSPREKLSSCSDRAS